MVFPVYGLTRGVRRAVRRVAVTAALLSMASGTGAARAEEDLLARSELPGVAVEAGSHRIHLHCMGEGSPVVILDSGLGAAHIDWYYVQPAVARYTRTCSYDRAGYGFSEMGPKPRTSHRIVEELRTVMRNARVEPPYVLVGHSFGGLNMQLFSRLYADDVSGLVLVDAVHPEQFHRFRAAGIELPGVGSTQFAFGDRDKLTRAFPEEQKDLAYALISSDKTRSSMLNELRNMERSADEVAREPGLPAVPLVVITHGRTIWGTRLSQKMEDLWSDMQAELAGASPQGQLVVAERSGHEIQLDEPEVVVGAIRSLLGPEAQAPQP